MTSTRLAVLLVVLMLPPTLASAQGNAAPKDAYLYIISPVDGETVKGRFWCRFGLRNMGVTHAGDNFPNSGHHHLLIDTSEPIDPGEPIPQDKNHLHYGAGETEAVVELPPGKHTLQLVLGNDKHFNFVPPVVSKKITITVSRADADASEERKNSARQRHDRVRRHTRTPPAGLQKPTTDAVPATPRPAGLGGFISRITGAPK
jgi:hypothetical protein